MNSSTVCRPASSPCDAVEMCSGRSQQCPPNATVAAMTPCDDGQSCTTNDVCLYDQCFGTYSCGCSADTDCQSRNPCMLGTCTNHTCQFAPKPSGTACSDNSACTLSDTCDGAGVCKGTPLVCPSDNNGGCTFQVCIPFGTSSFLCARGLQDQGYVCRNFTQACDVPEICSGDGEECPADTGSDCRVVGRTCIPGVQYEIVAATATTQRECRNATVCAPGELQMRALNATSDRICSANPCNFTVEFAEIGGDGVAVCEPISDCDEGQVQVRPPTRTSDRVCGTESTSNKGANGGSGGDNTIIIIIAAAVGGVALLLAVVLWKICKLRRMANKRKGRSTGSDSYFINTLFSNSGGSGGGGASTATALTSTSSSSSSSSPAKKGEGVDEMHAYEETEIGRIERNPAYGFGDHMRVVSNETYGFDANTRVVSNETYGFDDALADGGSKTAKADQTYDTPADAKSEPRLMVNTQYVDFAEESMSLSKSDGTSAASNGAPEAASDMYNSIITAASAPAEHSSTLTSAAADDNETAAAAAAAAANADATTTAQPEVDDDIRFHKHDGHKNPSRADSAESIISAEGGKAATAIAAAAAAAHLPSTFLSNIRHLETASRSSPVSLQQSPSAAGASVESPEGYIDVISE